MADGDPAPTVVPLEEVEQQRKQRRKAQSPEEVPPHPQLEPTAPPPIPLGYDRNMFFYMSANGRQVHGISADQHTKLKLMALASVDEYWERSKFFHPKLGMQWDKAAEWMMRCCESIGIYDPNLVRGRGAWMDGDHAVLHLGNKLLVDGDQVEIADFKTKHIYEHALPLTLTVGRPIDTAEAKKFVELCDLIAWESADMALLFAGWIVIAPICGALRWRPHFWLIGEAGSGKSWVTDNIVRQMLGGIALAVQSKTTEAGVRRSLRSDARPVIFDEAEGEKKDDRERMQTVLDLARQASQEDGAPIVKGNRTGGVDMFSIRSMFYFSSINIGLSQNADESRTITTSLVGRQPGDDPKERAERFAHLTKTALELLTPEYIAGFVARTLSLAPVIRNNAEFFARAAGEVFGSRRQGDTLGAVLAGVHSLYSHRPLTLDEAREFIQKKVWIRSAVARQETTPEYERCLNHLLEQVVRVTLQHGSQDRSISELIEAEWLSKDVVDEINLCAGDNLLRLGIQRVGPEVMLARGHTRLQQIYRDTAWANSWPATLGSIPGAEFVRGGRPIRFGSQVKRAVKIPMEAIFPDSHGMFVR